MVQAGLIDFLVTAAYMLIFGFFVRTTAARYPENPFSKALAFML
jgi:hypothetical protein